MQPVCQTLYIWGGGWNEEDTGFGETSTSIGVSSHWKKFFDSQNSSSDFCDYAISENSVAKTPIPAYNSLQLKLAERLDEVSGIIIGTLVPLRGATERGLLNAFFDALKDLDIPIIYNFYSGHISNSLALPICATLQIENEKVIIMHPIINHAN